MDLVGDRRGTTRTTLKDKSRLACYLLHCHSFVIKRLRACMNVRMVTHEARVWINQVRMSILHVVS